MTHYEIMLVLPRVSDADISLSACLPQLAVVGHKRVYLSFCCSFRRVNADYLHGVRLPFSALAFACGTDANYDVRLLVLGGWWCGCELHEAHVHGSLTVCRWIYLE
jgi:hypothetical protein